jgi:two-component system LytT family sensor kinase
MGKRLFLLLGTFVAFYYVIRITYDLPNWVHGYPQFIWWPRSLSAWLSRLADIAFYFLIVLIPYGVLFRWYPPKKVPLSLGLITAGLLALFLFRYWAAYTRLPHGLRLRTYFENTIVYVLIFAVYGAVFYFIRYSYYKEMQQKDLEIQNRQSELSFLRSQINPHFLFNNLNNIYSLVYHGSGQALTAIAGLSELLRYMLYDATEKVPLQKELDYIQKYIALQRLRFDHPIQVRMQVEGPAVETAIPPLLLIPFVENAFKHGDFSGTGHGLAVTVFTSAQLTRFHCSNRIAIRQKDSQGGIGLENVRRRLSLLYPGRHSLLIEEDILQFSVNLELIHE